MSRYDHAQIKTPALAGDYIELLKPRIMMLVVFTALAGLVVAANTSSAPFNPIIGVIALIAIAMASGGAGAINMWFDRDIDAIMTRTSTRPIPSGKVPAEEALATGIIFSLASTVLMLLAAGILPAMLLAGSIFYYAVIYTMWLKRLTPHNIVIGGGAGAFPPVIAWSVVTGTTPVDAWILFAIIFFWTPPHFWALSLLANKEYEKAGVPMLPVTHGAKATRDQIALYSLALFAVSFAPCFTGLGGWVYTVGVTILNAGFGYGAFMVWRSAAGDVDSTPTEKKGARNLFLYSILYLFVLFALVIVEHGLKLYIPLNIV